MTFLCNKTLMIGKIRKHLVVLFNFDISVVFIIHCFGEIIVIFFAKLGKFLYRGTFVRLTCRFYNDKIKPLFVDESFLIVFETA